MKESIERAAEIHLREIVGGRECDIVTGTTAFTPRIPSARIYCIISNEDDARIETYSYAEDQGDTPVAVTGLSYMSTKRVDTITLTGTGGTATIVCNGETDTATFNTSLTITASDFVTANAADYLTADTVLTSVGAVLTITAVVPGTDFTGATSGANATGDLLGTAATTTANKLFAFNDNKIIFPDYPLTSITLGKGTVFVYYI